MPDVDLPGPDEPRGVGASLKSALVGAHDALADTIDARKRSHLEGILHQAEADLAPIIGPVVQRILDSPEASDELKAVMREAGTPAHQFGSLVVGFALGATIAPALGAALAPEIQGIENVAWNGNPSRPISPDVAVAATLKNVLGPHNPAAEAALSGYNGSRFAQMVEAAGNALGFEQALELERRGLLVGITVDDVLRYSNVNPKFYASARNLITNPVSVGEVLNARIRTHLDDGTARDLYRQAGGIPAEYQWRLDSVGRPPGPMEVLDLWNRHDAGLPGYTVDETQVDAMLAQSDLALAFQAKVKELRHYLPPPRSIVPMLRSKAITEAQARQLLAAYGVGEPWASAFIIEGTHPTSSVVKGLTQAQIVAQYEARLMDRPTANGRLTALGYDAADAAAYLDLADEKRKGALLNATVRMVGARYVAHKLTKADASHLLATAGTPNAAQLDLFTLWDIERQANLHFPTPAGIVGAGRRGILTPAEVKVRLNELGIANADLPIFVGDGWPPTHALEAQAAAHAVVAGLASWPAAVGGGGPAGKNLTVTQIGKAYTAGALGRAAAIADLTTLGYTVAQATELVATFTPHVPPIP